MLTPRRGRLDAVANSREDSGISLVEVMVGMVVTAIIGSMMVMYLISAVGNARRADGQTEQASGARIALDSWSALVPLAVDSNGESSTELSRFYSIGPLSAKFCAGLRTKSLNPLIKDDLKPIGVEIALIGGQLIENRWSTCAGMTLGGVHAHRVLARNAAPAATGIWLLTPLAAADLPTGGVTTGLVTSTLTVGQQTLNSLVLADAARIQQITSLQLAFRTLPDPRRPAPAATYSTVLALTRGG